MPTLGCSIDSFERLVVVSGIGVFDLRFYISYVSRLRTQGAAGYCKLLDLRQADIRLSPEDFAAICTFTRKGDGATAGPTAMVIGENPPHLLLDMAILLKQRIGTARRFKLFTNKAEASRWLALGSIPMVHAGILIDNLGREGARA